VDAAVLEAEGLICAGTLCDIQLLVLAAAVAAAAAGGAVDWAVGAAVLGSDGSGQAGALGDHLLCCRASLLLLLVLFLLLLLLEVFIGNISSDSSRLRTVAAVEGVWGAVRC
jgi:hypothetical protein